MPTEIHYSILVFYQPYNPDAALLFIIYPTLLQRLLVTFIPQIFTAITYPGLGLRTGLQGARAHQVPWPTRVHRAY